jgi:hypothetical protein
MQYPTGEGDSMGYKFGDLKSKIQDDWEDDIPTQPTHQKEWGRLPTEKVFACFVYESTDLPAPPRVVL